MSNRDSFSQPVEVKINVQIGARFEGSDLVITFRYDPPTYLAGESGVRIPLGNFRDNGGALDPDKLSRFFARVMVGFEATKTLAVERDLQLHFADVVLLLTASDGIDGVTVSEAVERLSENRKKIVNDSLREMAPNMREGDRKPKRSKHWTSITLTAAILEAAADLRPGQFNYANVHRRVKERHPETAPVNLETFKKLAQRLGIQWKTLKSHASARTTPTKQLAAASKRDSSTA